ncbi:extracellular solute-binding protein [Bacillus solitudinis]|uniref:extracellular solute-binding protein n=1 Tax=Bacillus solitudinis TaxID=2014074 RepID=UPI000C23FC93|nr:extracellular solute-binding protein [Bacillus solitudinis]
MQLKKFLNITSLLTMVWMLSACNPKEATIPEQQHIKNLPEISMMLNLHTPEVPNERIRLLLEEKTGTKLDIQWVPDNNYNDRLNTAFATGTLPDVVLMGFPTFLQYKDMIRDEQFWEIGPYLNEYENLRKLDSKTLTTTLVDEKLYTLYQGRPVSRQGIIYRKDWADNLKLTAPRSTEEFLEMARAFTEDDPNQSGKADTIGLVDRSDLMYGAFKTISSWFGTPNEWGMKDGKLLPEFMFEEYMQTLDFVKKIHENGYMNNDFPVTSKTDQRSMFKNGVAGMYVGSMEDVESLYLEAKEHNPSIEFDVHNYVEGPNGRYQIWGIPGFASVVLFPKSSVKTEEELKIILSFYDYLMKPEIANILIWGIEGEHYTVQNGKAKISEDRRSFEREVRPYLSMEIGEPETNGRLERFNEYEPAIKAQELNIDNEKYVISNPALTLDSETQLLDGERLSEMIEDATYKYILGQIDRQGFERTIETWKAEGGLKIIDELNAPRKTSRNLAQ